MRRTVRPASTHEAPSRRRRRAASPAVGGQTADERQLAALLAQERRRAAADVHDLVMQDLALALAYTRALAARADRSREVEIVLAASERALAGARKIVDGLLEEDRDPVLDVLPETLRAAARDVPVRFTATGLDDGVQPDAPTLQTLLHIGRESVTNAVKHAQPTALEVELEHGDEWRLRVCDDGHGFDPGGEPSPGFGLRSMREQANALGGTLRVLSGASSGTVVEAILP